MISSLISYLLSLITVLLSLLPAKTHRQLSGQSGTDGLTDLQRSIYNHIQSKSKATRQELMKVFELKEWELEKSRLHNVKRGFSIL